MAALDLGISGRRAVVAASSAGLGLAAALALHAAGCVVAISGRDTERLAAAKATMPGAHAFVADVSTVDGATALIAEATALLGGIDILVTNAGGPPVGNFASTAVDAYPAALELNLLSVVAMCKAAVPAMVTQGWGRVVAITSISAQSRSSVTPSPSRSRAPGVRRKNARARFARTASRARTRSCSFRGASCTRRVTDSSSKRFACSGRR